METVAESKQNFFCILKAHQLRPKSPIQLSWKREEYSLTFNPQFNFLIKITRKGDACSFTEKALCPSGKCSSVSKHNVQSEHPWLAVEPSRMVAFLLLFSAVFRRIPGSGTSPNGWHCRLPWSFADNLWLMILTCRQISALILRQISSKQTTNIRLTTHKYWPTNICQRWTSRTDQVSQTALISKWSPRILGQNLSASNL